MKVIALNPETPISERFVTKEIGEELKDLQAEVQGDIECFTIEIKGNEYDIWLNDVGKLDGLMPNIAIRSDGQIVDYLAGNLVIAKADEEGRTIGLTDEDIQHIKEYFEANDAINFTVLNQHVFVYDFK